MKMNRILRPHSYLAVTARAVSPILSFFEHIYFQNKEFEEIGNRPIFIVGSPRSGSTILYQLLTHCIDYLYIDNLACPFHRNMPFGIWLSRRVFGSRNHNSFESRYGNTPTLHSPSECQSFWYRWFPKDRDFVDHGDVSERKLHDLRKVIRSIMDKHKRDFVFKNLSCGQRIRVIREAFPNAIFISIKRDPVYTAQSLLLARRKLGLPDDVWWSVKPHNYLELQKLPIKNKLINQIYYCEKQIKDDLKELANKNKIEINYVDYGVELNQLLQFLGYGQINSIDTSRYEFKNRKILDGREFKELENIAKDFDWRPVGYE